MIEFEEYKFFAQSTQHLSERRQAATQIYLTRNTALFAVIAFLIKDAGLKGFNLLAVSIPLFVVGGLACLIWHKLITRYKTLIGWRYDQLMEMEQNMPDSQQIYIKEQENFYHGRQGQERFGFSTLEAWLPRLFMTLYVVYFLLLIAAIACGWKI